MKRLWNAIRRVYLRGLITEARLGLYAEQRRQQMFPHTVRLYHFEIARLEQALERAGGNTRSRVYYELGGLNTPKEKSCHN